MAEITYDDMVSLVQRYCDLVPELSPARTAEMDALLTPNCAFGYPNDENETEFVAARWEDQARYYLYYEPHPCYIHVDERLSVANVIIREEVRDPKTGELIKDYFDKHAFDKAPGLDGVAYLHQIFGFAIHDGEPRIDSVFVNRLNTNTEQWKRWVAFEPTKRGSSD